MIKVAFICVENACRSQMAEGFAKNLGKGLVEAHSAGSHPAKEIDSLTVKVMKEKGTDISCHKPKGFLDMRERNFDYVITMGCQDACPFLPSRKSIQWDIPDPKGGSIETFPKVRDTIENKVKTLMQKVVNDKIRSEKWLLKEKYKRKN
jgi:arsenate reductase